MSFCYQLCDKCGQNICIVTGITLQTKRVWNYQTTLRQTKKQSMDLSMHILQRQKSLKVYKPRFCKQRKTSTDFSTYISQKKSLLSYPPTFREHNIIYGNSNLHCTNAIARTRKVYGHTNPIFTNAINRKRKVDGRTDPIFPNTKIVYKLTDRQFSNKTSNLRVH